MKEIALSEIFTEEEIKELHIIKEEMDIKALEKFCTKRKDKLEKKSIFDIYLFYVLCYKFGFY